MTPEFSEPTGTELVVVSAPDDAALEREIRRLVAFIDRVSNVQLVDIAYTCSLATGAAKLCIIAGDVHDLRARLASAADRLATGNLKRLKDKSGTYYFREPLLGEGRGKLAFVFPGVPSFYPDMVRDLAILYPECRTAFDELEEALADVAEFTPSNFVFPPASYYRHDADIFSSGAYAQALVATFAASSALARLVKAQGLRPDGVVGCAGGDLASVMRSGAAGESISRPDRVKILSDIYRIVDKAVDHEGLPKTALVSILLRHEGEADELIASFPKDKVMLAMDLSPRQKTYVVTPDFEEAALAAFANAGIRAVKNPLDRPFNTPLAAKMVPAVRKFADRWMRFDPVCDVYSCRTAALLSRKPRHARSDTAERWATPIRFVETIRQMYADGYRVFLEVGPRGLMTTAVDDILGDLPHAAIALNSIHRRGLLQAQHGFAQLIAQGADVSISATYARRGAKKLDFDAAISLQVREEVEMRLSRTFPKLTLLGDEAKVPGTEYLASEPRVRGGKAAQRAAVIAEQKRRLARIFAAARTLREDEVGRR